jgi:hypothetical protein
MRYSKKIPLFSKLIWGSEDQTVQVLRWIDQAIRSVLILRLGQ